jgi:hypothetical protein
MAWLCMLKALQYTNYDRAKKKKSIFPANTWDSDTPHDWLGCAWKL